MSIYIYIYYICYYIIDIDSHINYNNSSKKKTNIYLILTIIDNSILYTIRGNIYFTILFLAIFSKGLYNLNNKLINT